MFKTASANQTAIIIDPQNSYVTIGKTLSININVTNVANLTCWQFTLYFLNSILNCTDVIEGPFLRTGGSTYFNKTINNNYNATHGSILAYSTLLGPNSANGSGTLATINFEALSVGESPLHLTETKLGDEKIPPQPIPHTTIDGLAQVQNFILTVTTVGSGSVTLNATGPYHYGEAVLLTAIPNLGWRFDHWSGDLSGSTNPAELTITGNMSVTATFIQEAYTLTINIVGMGNVILNNTGPYNYGDIVLLTAVPALGWHFEGWSGDLSGSTNPTTLVITGNMYVTATFIENVYTLTVNVVGNGIVELNNTGPYYHYGDVVLLTAIPDPGWSFLRWSGNLVGPANPATLEITANMSVTATFTQNIYILTINVVGNGVVNLNNTGPYDYGDVVLLTAVPAAGWTFQCWSGDLSGSTNPTTIIMDNNKTVTATFTENVYILMVTTVGSGTVILDKAGPYHYGDVVVLTAIPAAGWTFQCWSGDLSDSTNPATLIMTANFSVTAVFLRKPMLQMSPANKTCRIYGENFTLIINISNAFNVRRVAFEIHYNTTLLDYVNVTWIAWGSGTITVDEANGIIRGSTAGAPLTGAYTLFTLKFRASLHHIWKSAPGWKNDLTDNIFLQWANVSYPTGPDLHYERGDQTQVNVGPDFTYTFSPIQGDVNNDGIVDVYDLRPLGAYYDVKQGDPNWSEASTYDLNGDGIINIEDLKIVEANFQYQYIP
jgi:uncharacterized repeat protein (TIGR02543 family)